MSGAWAMGAVLGGVSAVMAALMLCRGHWYALADIMHRLPADLLARLDWPTQHPFDVPDPERPRGAPFPVRRLRARVLLRGLPDPRLCPAPARRHARAYRLWGGVTLALLLGAGAVWVSPLVLGLGAAALGLHLALTPPWPRPERPA